MSDAAYRPLSRLDCFSFMVSMIGVQLASELFAQWGTYFYSPSVDTGRMVYVSIGVVALIFMAGRIVDIVTDPLIGVWTDRAQHRPGRFRIIPIQGRRRPFIFWGSILMTGTGIAFWYPPVDGESSTNLLYGTIVMSVHWAMYTLAYIPLLALAPEIARSQADRIRLGTWIAVGMILGLVAAALMPGALITILDPARQGAEESFSPVGYQRVAILFSLISLASFQWFVWTVRERPTDPRSTQVGHVYKEFFGALRIPQFRLYLLIFFLFYIGVLANQRALPYWVELGLGGDEATLSVLGIPFIVTCLLSALACPLLIKRFALKWLVVMALGSIALSMPIMYVVAVSEADETSKLLMGSVVYGMKGVGLGMMYVLVTPLIGEIIDRGESLLGIRQEAVFNSMHAMMVKAAQVIGIWIAATTMARFGNSAESPLGVFLVGPLSGLFCVAAVLVATRYPSAHEPDDEGTIT